MLFALAICGDPDLLFLDEPTVGLDVEARRMLWDEIRQLVSRGKTVLLTTHYLQEADAWQTASRSSIKEKSSPREHRRDQGTDLGQTDSVYHQPEHRGSSPDCRSNGSEGRPRGG